jgi:HD superfamily phosphohydrolase
LNKKKIFNDPVYGFLTIPGDLIFDIIEHPYFQRLRRIKQLGLTDMVYPGALHTRFHHALGAMHLMGITLDSLAGKGHFITEEEREAVQIAILLHDIGHGPFSHALEFSLLPGVKHEDLSRLIMQRLNEEFKGKLQMAIDIFNDTYPRRFFHQRVSSQLDMDRLDYLQRDCFFTGVSEGTIGIDRILKMLEVVNDRLVVEEKGIYSIENFLTARRLMYWQVYLHKTTVSSEKMVTSIIKRSKDLYLSGKQVFASPALAVFLKNNVTCSYFVSAPVYLDEFTTLDDYDIWGAIKVWVNDKDDILSFLCHSLLTRKLFKIDISAEEIDNERIENIKERILDKLVTQESDLNYFLYSGILSNAAYLSESENINILTKKGKLTDVAEASDLPNIKALGKIVEKYFVCCPKQVYI